jgi:bifunctional UDP-N-acetylglucosamine pyrophosphorylase / glucosamine-1-phosphate N-acetyltransferase
MMKAASLIFAAGRGSRLQGFDGNKTLLPLIPGNSSFEGERPILLHILHRLPPGPKALVVNFKKDEVMKATRLLDLSYYDQPSLNGTGGALLAAKGFLEGQVCRDTIITMGDVPFVKAETYQRLALQLELKSLVVLGFHPQDKRQYGLLETEGDGVKRIIEWKYWKNYSLETQREMTICNAGIYAARRNDLLDYLELLAKRPHVVSKERNGRMVEIEEFFITDLVEMMQEGGLSVGYVLAEDENEVMGIDDLPSLQKAQRIFRDSHG